MKELINHFLTRAAMTLPFPTLLRRLPVAFATLLLTLTAMTAWATTKTITYTIRYNSDTYYWLDGSDNTHYNIGSGFRMAQTYTMPMGDVTITITAEDYRCHISESDCGIEGFYDNYTFTFASSNYYITKVRLRDVVRRHELSVDNDTRVCTFFWNSHPSWASPGVYYNVQQIEVTISDTKPLFYYGITYEPNGGTNAAGNPQSYEKSAGVASFVAPTRAGYTFGGWYDNSEFNGTAVTSIAAGSTGDKTLYAKWMANIYSVCFNANGGMGSMSNQTLTYDAAAQALTTNAFTRVGHNFSGWNTAANGSGTAYANGASVSNLATEQGAIVNLYARWTPINYQVTFNANGHGTDPAAQTVAYGTKATEPTAPTASGYTFGGWYRESSCVNRWEFGADNVTGNTTLYAKWAQNVYTITYALDGGVNSASNPLVYTNTDNITLAEPTKTGYTFTGWTPDNGVISSGSTGNKTFTATWQVNQYTITFNTDGGTVISGSTDPITQNYGTTVSAPTATLAKQGHLFNGWADLPATMPGENITVYPDWTKLLHLNEVAPTCTVNGSMEHYYGNNKDWTENSDGLTYTEINTEALVIPKTGHTWGTPQWTWGYNYLGELAAEIKVVCTQCGYVMTTSTYASDTRDENSFKNAETTAPTETRDGVMTYTATIGTFYDYTGLSYSDTHQEAIPRTFKVAKIGSTEYSYLKDAIEAAASGDVITLYGNVIEPNTFCSVPHDYSITLDLNGHSVLIDKISTMNSLTVKNGSLVCNIDNGNVGESNTLTLDNAKLTCVGVYDSKWNLWSSGIQWMADKIDLKNRSIMYITGGASLGSGDDDFTLTIDGGSCAVLENVTLNSYNMGRVKTQLEQYMPTGYTIEVVNYENGKVLKNGVEYNGSVTLGPSDITLADNADNSALISAYNGYEKNVTLSGRTLARGGNWNTLCLPFSMDATQIAASDLAGATIKELKTSESNLANDGTLTLSFTTVYDPTDPPSGSIVAGKPYIVKWDASQNLTDITSPTFPGVSISSTEPEAVEFDIANSTDKCQFVGQYSPFSIVANDAVLDENQGHLNEIIMLGSGNTLGYSQSAPRTLRCFRAHFYVPANGGAAARAFVMNFGDGETTGIVSMEDGGWKMEDVNDAWYSIDGRKLNGEPTQKGVYINNGRKVVIK